MQMIVEIKLSNQFKKNLNGYQSFPGYTIAQYGVNNPLLR